MIEIEDFYSINKAKIEINKINVVGGVNGSGKSSVSRLFYSFLRANSERRFDFILKGIISRANKVIDTLNFEGNEYNLPNHLKIDDDFSDICDVVGELLKISETHEKIANLKKEELSNKTSSVRERLINKGMFGEPDDDYIDYSFVDSLYEEPGENKELLDDLSELEELTESYQQYDVNIHKLCMDLYDETNEFLRDDNPSVRKNIFKRTLLKEHIELNNENFNVKLIIDYINRIIDDLNFKGNSYNLPNHLTIEDNLPTLNKTLNILLKISKDYEKIANEKKKELKKEILAKFDSVINMLINKNIDVSDILSAVYSINDDDYTDSLYYIHLIFKENGLDFDYSDYFYELNSLVDLYNHFNYSSDIYQRCLAVNSVINEFFDEDFLARSEKSINELVIKDNIKDFNDNIRFIMLPQESDAFKYFFKDSIDGVYYVDNVSIFDAYQKEISFNKRLLHMDELIGDIYGDTYVYDLNEEFKNIMNKIEKIIKGRYDQKYPIFVTDKQNDAMSFIKSYKKNLETYNTSTPSGIKQIGIIQLLLLNNKLKKGSYLIIDEPEVNLHPEWQFKFAEILVLLAKELDITIYLNSHSPMFIEAIEVLTMYYDLENETNFYLTEKQDNDKYNFVKIDYDNLFELYDNLAKPYDAIEVYRLKAEYRKGNY